jgi:hypothetical protein
MIAAKVGHSGSQRANDITEFGWLVDVIYDDSSQ